MLLRDKEESFTELLAWLAQVLLQQCMHYKHKHRSPPFMAGLSAQQSKHSQWPHLLVIIQLGMFTALSHVLKPSVVPSTGNP